MSIIHTLFQRAQGQFSPMPIITHLQQTQPQCQFLPKWITYTLFQHAQGHANHSHISNKPNLSANFYPSESPTHSSNTLRANFHPLPLLTITLPTRSGPRHSATRSTAQQRRAFPSTIFSARWVSMLLSARRRRTNNWTSCVRWVRENVSMCYLSLLDILREVGAREC